MKRRDSLRWLGIDWDEGPGTPDELGASIGPSAALAAALGCVVPTDWPPLHWEAGPVDWMLGKMREQPDEVFWRAWFVLWRPGAESAGTVGAGPETPVPTLVFDEVDAGIGGEAYGLALGGVLLELDGKSGG